MPDDIRYLGETLVDRGLLTKENLSQALDICQDTGKSLGNILVEKGFVKETDLTRVLGKKMKDLMPVDLLNKNIPQDIINKLPASIVQIYNIVPIDFKADVLTIAMADPFNIQILDDLKFRLGFEVKGVPANEEDIKKTIQKKYGEKGSSFEDVLGEIKDDKQQKRKMAIKAADKEIDDASLKELANQAPVIKLLNLILLQAIKDKASDIHLEPFENEFKVRYRVDGTLYDMSPPPKSLSLAIASRIKVMANLDISERRLPQDGRILMKIGNTNVDLRVSTLPTAHGESVVIRVLDKSVVSLSLDQIGMRQDTLEIIRTIIRKPNGIFLVTGPTGSGKTTTLYSALREINNIETKIITTEDPVEYDIDGIIQIPINPKIELNFARCLRAILRQDPDVIMVGEIRDEETAQIAVQSALTGHLVFSTLHTNDATGAITRLLDMGIEPFLITSSLEAILAQRLVRTICADCKEAYEPLEAVFTELGLNKNEMAHKKFYRGAGCDVCHHSGYKGRTGIYELFQMNSAISALIAEKAPAVVLRQKAQEAGMITLREYGIMKIFDGVTTSEEVIRETQLYT